MNQNLVIIPTYNERENLDWIVGRVLASAPPSTCSSSTTVRPTGPVNSPTRYAAARRPRLRCCTAPRRRASAPPTWPASPGASSAATTALVEMDADGSHHPEYLPAMIALLADNDLVLGSRWVPGGRVENWPLHREAAESRVAAGTPAAPSASAWRTRPAAIGPSDRPRSPRSISTGSSRGGTASRSTCCGGRCRPGLRVVETPITFTERVHGDVEDGCGRSSRSRW